jgi:Ca2+-binding EF-hand superfamily protein
MSGIDTLFKAVDRNGDGNVTRRELMGALNNGSESAKALHDLLCETLGLPDKVTNRDARSAFELSFDCLDRDGSGTIDRTEMHNFVNDMLYIADLYRRQKEMENSAGSSSPSTPAAGNRMSSSSSSSSRRSSSMSFANEGGRRTSSFQGGAKKPLPESLTELDPKIVEVLERTDVDGDGVLSNVEIIRAMRNHSEMRDLLRIRELERARAAEAAGGGRRNQEAAP